MSLCGGSRGRERWRRRLHALAVPGAWFVLTACGSSFGSSDGVDATAGDVASAPDGAPDVAQGGDVGTSDGSGRDVAGDAQELDAGAGDVSADVAGEEPPALCCTFNCGAGDADVPCDGAGITCGLGPDGGWCMYYQACSGLVEKCP